MKQVDFVGSTVSGDGVSIQQSKLEAVRKLEIPQTIAQVKSLLGFMSFLRTHVPYYCDVAAPIQDFLMMPNATTNMKLEGFWTEEHNRSFAMMKDLLLDNRVLAFPDSSKLYILYTDAFKKAMSGVLMQEADDVEHTTVVRLRRDRDQVFQDCDLYIGQQVKHSGWDLEASRWANPFKLTRKNSDRTEETNMTRTESLKRYQQHVLDSPELMASLHELKGKRLGCWCHPDKCHGDILIELLEEKYPPKLHPIGYWSKSFKGSQHNWAALVKEARAVKEAVEHFAVFIEGCPVTLRCDHKPLERFLEAQTHNEMVNHWSLEIQHFDLKFEWVSSKKNLSDCLSRMNDAKLFQDHDVMDTDFPTKPICQEIDPKTHTS